MTMDQLHPGQTATITAVGGEGSLRLRLLDMGVLPGTPITLEKIAPLGDPMEFSLRDYVLTLRAADARTVEVQR